MNQDDIIRMAREAGYSDSQDWSVLIRFAVLVAAAEREECAYKASVALLGADLELANRVIKTIRARGQK